MGEYQHVLVAGATGFLGAHVLLALIESGYKVTSLSRRQITAKSVGRNEASSYSGKSSSPPSEEDLETVICHPRVRHIAVPNLHLQRCSLSTSALSALTNTPPCAVINLCGIKREIKDQTFEAVHVTLTQNLIDFCVDAQVGRYVHISVACVASADETSNDLPRLGYHDTKFLAEELIRESPLPEWTILRPTVIFGRDDDCITSLVRSLRLAVPFPLVGWGTAMHQPVRAEDVAGVVVAAVSHPKLNRVRLDVAGPEQLTLKTMAGRVAEACQLPTIFVPCPPVVHSTLAAIMEKTMSSPLVTSSQFMMLSAGMCGRRASAELLREIGLAPPRPFSVEYIRQVEGGIPSFLGVSTRLLPSREQRQSLLRSIPPNLGSRAITLAILAILVIWTVSLTSGRIWSDNIWGIMSVSHLLLLPCSLVMMPHLLSPPPSISCVARSILHGVLLAFPLYLFVGVGQAATNALLTYFLGSDEFTSQKMELIGWADLIPSKWLQLFLLVGIVIGEDVVFRGAILPPLMAWFCKSHTEKHDARSFPTYSWCAALSDDVLVPCCLSAAMYAAAHLFAGPPLLTVAAFVMGVLFNVVRVRSGSLVTLISMHVVWDLLVCYVAPY